MDRELKITPPKGYEIDRENSTLDCIRFKPVVKRWRDKMNASIHGFYISNRSNIMDYKDCLNQPTNYNVFATEKQAKSALAMARISQIMANDERFGGVVTDEEWNDRSVIKYVIERLQAYKIRTAIYDTSYCFLAFHEAEQRSLFLEENKDLVEDYLMID